MHVLTPLKQRDVEFYDDRITAVQTNSGVYVPVKPICDMLGVDWNGQRRRINRDAVLSEEKRTVDVTSIEGDRQVTRSVICLLLDFVSGFLFDLNADRVRADLKEKVIRYKQECYRRKQCNL